MDPTQNSTQKKVYHGHEKVRLACHFLPARGEVVIELMEVFTAEGALFFALVRVRETSAVKTSRKLGGFKRRKC